MKPVLLDVITDYQQPGELANSEIISTFHRLIKRPWLPNITGVAAFDHLSLGFAVAQLTLDANTDAVLYGNCAPRHDRAERRKHNAGEQLLFATLNNGRVIFVVNSGFSLAFVREAITTLKAVAVDNKGSQFRSRDLYPAPVASYINDEMEGILAQDLDPQVVIPEVPEDVVSWIDNFGNLKLSTTAASPSVEGLEPGQQIRLRIGNETFPATVTVGSFENQHGACSFGPGSSGPKERPFWEIFWRGTSAQRIFRVAHTGAKVTVLR